jgi:hypothetical protein
MTDHSQRPQASAELKNPRAVSRIQWIIIACALLAAGAFFVALTLDRTPPVAVLRSGATRVEEGAPIRFSAIDSTDNIGFLRYRWDFGDGTTTGPPGSGAPPLPKSRAWTLPSSSRCST